MIVLDTHAWLWWASAPDRLSAAASNAVTSAERIGVSTLSCWEVAMLATRARISLDRPIAQWIRAALRVDERITAIPPDADVAIGAALLGDRGFHGDPADRFIFATATALDAVLVTRDAEMRRFDRQRTVW